MDVIDLLQWPAMVVTVAAAYLVASRSAHKRASSRVAPQAESIVSRSPSGLFR